MYYDALDNEYQTKVLGLLATNPIRRTSWASYPLFLVVAPVAPHVGFGREGSAEWFDYFETEPYYKLVRKTPDPRSCRKQWAATTPPAPEDEEGQPGYPSWVHLWYKDKPSYNEPNMLDKPNWLPLLAPPLSNADEECLAKQYRDRLASLKEVDRLIGLVVNTQKQYRDPTLTNTVLIFTSDNGFMHAEHRLSEKLFAYEESILVPLYIRAPGFPQQTTSRIALNNDLAPTILALAGVTRSDIQYRWSFLAPAAAKSQLIPFLVAR